MRIFDYSYLLSFVFLLGIHPEDRMCAEERESTSFFVAPDSSTLPFDESGKFHLKRERTQRKELIRIPSDFSVSPRQIIHEEMFDEGKDFDTIICRLLPQSGDWIVVEGGKYLGHGHGERINEDLVVVYAVSQFFGHQFSDFRMTCQVRFVSGSQNQIFGILFRQTNDVVYLFGVDKSGNAHLFKNINKIYHNIYGPEPVSGDFSNTINTIEVRTQGNQIDLFVNDARQGTFRDRSSLCGAVGLFVSYDITATFDNLRIEAEDYCDPPSLTPSVTPTSAVLPTPSVTRTPSRTPTPLPTATITPTRTPLRYYYFFDLNENDRIEDEEIGILQEYWAGREPLPVMFLQTTKPGEYVSFDTYFFDTNGNKAIDDAEILLLYNYWIQNRVLPSIELPNPTPTPTPEGGAQEITIDLPGLSEGAKRLELVRIPAGTFIMGSPSGEVGKVFQ